MKQPSITATRHILPFDRLSPGDFERLCLWLIEAEGYQRPSHFGLSGKDSGRDILAYQRGPEGEEAWIFQAKRTQRIHFAVLKDELDKVIAYASQPQIKISGVAFITPAVLSASARDRTLNYAAAYGIAVEFWAATELDLRVKRYPNILAEFFNLPSPQREMKSVRPVCVFIASPGDTVEERNVITDIVGEINRDDGRREGYRIDLLLWEEEAYSDIGVDAQEVITRQIGDYDIFLGFMSTRFGSPTKRSNSGTEEEFNRAFDKYLHEPNSIKLQFYFRNPTVKLSEIDPYQVLQVRRFRDRIAALGVYFGEYETIEGTRGFRELVRRNLAHAIRDLVHGKSKVAQSRHVNQANTRVEIVELPDWTGTTGRSYAQSGSYYEVPLSRYSYSYFSLQGNFQSESSYFRFGFKLLTMAAPALGDTTIQSSRDDNLVLHIGKNTGRDKVFFTIYRGAVRVGSDQPFLNYKDRRQIPIEIFVSQDDVCRLIVDNVSLYEKQISRDIKRRLLLVAWGDEHEYEVHFRNIRLELA